MGSSSDEDGVFSRGSPLPDTIGDAKVGGLRQRRKKPLGQLQEKPVAEAFKKLDFHPKAERTATRRASTGGVVSIVCYVIILMLVVSETAEYLRSDTADELRVDTRRADGRMKVALDISFYAIPCTSLSVDVLDADGEQMSDTAHSTVRTRISSVDGSEIGHLTQPILGSSAIMTSRHVLPLNHCGSCYRAAQPGSQKCCNSCFDLKKEYIAAGIPIQEAENSEQCLRDSNTFPEAPPAEGCRIHGYLDIRKTKGNFHVAAGSAVNQHHSQHKHHVHRIVKEEIANFNASHYIHQLQFGDPLPGAPAPPLVDFQYITDSLVHVKYILKIVPTEYEYSRGNVLESYQYAATFHNLPIDLSAKHYPLPGAFFHFEFSELRIHSSPTSLSFWAYLLRVCSSVGGVFVCIGLIYKYLRAFVTKIFPSSAQSLVN